MWNNPVYCFAQNMANDSPSPGGEGRGEGGHETFTIYDLRFTNACGCSNFLVNQSLVNRQSPIVNSFSAGTIMQHLHFFQRQKAAANHARVHRCMGANRLPGKKNADNSVSRRVTEIDFGRQTVRARQTRWRRSSLQSRLWQFVGKQKPLPTLPSEGGCVVKTGNYILEFRRLLARSASAKPPPNADRNFTKNYRSHSEAA